MTCTHSAILVRRLGPGDLLAALAIQAEVYPSFLLEDKSAFASRLNAAASYCLAATSGEALVGYLLAHGWPSQRPPSIGEVLASDASCEVLFIHDLGVSAREQGSGIGRRLVTHAFSLAAADGLQRTELIAVEGAFSYWRSLGFNEGPIPIELAAKVEAYGPGARWMTHDATVE